MRRCISPYFRDGERRYRAYLYRAQRKGIEITLNERQVKQMYHSPCAYCGTRPTRDNLNGIDRIDSSGGYTPKNTVPCCARCNYMKGTHDMGTFLCQVARIYQHTCNNIGIIRTDKECNMSE